MTRVIFIKIISLLAIIFSLPIQAATPTIRIALVGPFTGTYAAYGTLLLSGATQAVNDINAKQGIHGVKLEIAPIDDQCDPQIAVIQATKIINDKKIPIVLGHVCSSASLATATLYAKANILVITPTATNSKITQKNITTLFRMTGHDEHQSIAAANFITQKLRSKRVAVIHDHDLYSKDLADLVNEHLLKLGNNPILYQAIPRGTQNFTKLVKKLKKLNADAVYFAGLYPEVSALAKTLYNLNLSIPLISADGITLHKFLAAVDSPDIASSILMTFATDPHGLISSRNTITNMQQQKLETTGYALYTYAAVQVIAKAIENTNNTDGTKLAAWLHQHEVDTVLGKISWDSNGDISQSEFKVYAWQKDASLVCY